MKQAGSLGESFLATLEPSLANSIRRRAVVHHHGAATPSCPRRKADGQASCCQEWPACSCVRKPDDR